MRKGRTNCNKVAHAPIISQRIVFFKKVSLQLLVSSVCMIDGTGLCMQSIQSGLNDGLAGHVIVTTVMLGKGARQNIVSYHRSKAMAYYNYLIIRGVPPAILCGVKFRDRKSTRLNSS